MYLTQSVAALTTGVCIDAPGHVEVDYQTTLEVANANDNGNILETVPPFPWRRYFADADFQVALAGDGAMLAAIIHRTMRASRWPLFLGRKGYVPGKPVYLPEGDVSVSFEIGRRVYAERRVRRVRLTPKEVPA